MSLCDVPGLCSALSFYECTIPNDICHRSMPSTPAQEGCSEELVSPRSALDVTYNIPKDIYVGV